MPKTGGKKLVYPESNLVIKISPLDSNQKALEALSTSLIKHLSVQKYLKRKKYRVLSCELVDSEADSEIKSSSRPTTSSDLYHTTFYDYTTNRVIIVDGHLNKRCPLNIIESNSQPMPSNEEFDEAIEILMMNSEIGSAIREKALQIYHPMPPLINEELPDGRIERTIVIGLLPEGNGPHQHEIVGVNMIRQTVVRFEGGVPKTSMASSTTCGLPSAGQPVTNKGTPGQIRVVIKSEIGIEIEESLQSADIFNKLRKDKK